MNNNLENVNIENKKLKNEILKNSIGEIYLAGGCFWGVEAFFKNVPGVIETNVGYANGKTKETHYKIIGVTDHSETVYIKYDKSKVSLEVLLNYYFQIIDPTSINKQGHDRGRQYRTGIYYVNEDDLNVIDKVMEKEQKKYNEKIQVEVEELKHFILGEEYHQDYLDKNPTGYCHINMAEAIKIIK